MKSIVFILVLFLSIPLYSQNAADLEVEIDGLRNKKGKLSITLFNNADGFPDDADKAIKWKTLDLGRDKPVFLFKDLPPGNYAYAILHDEDRNGEMNKNLIGIPREGFGFSNNYRPRVKSPSFPDAKVKLKSGKNRHVIEMVYML